MPLNQPSSMNFHRTYGKVLRHVQIGLTISMPSARRTASLTRKITLGLGQHVDVTGDRAYVVVPAHPTFKQNEKRVTESDPVLTVTLQKIADSWRIAGWAWAKR
ncbi:MAG TPA: hypothetical protein VI358_15140 [Pseudolabrys sp.]